MGSPTTEDLIKPERILQKMRECESSVRWKASTQSFEIDTLRWAASTRNSLRDGSYRSKGFHNFDIVERGKPRHIQSLHISDRTAQKLVCQYAIAPQAYPRLIYDNSASQKGKGTEFALKRLREHLRWHLARYGKKGAVIVMDYHAYFDSIPHEGLIKCLTNGIEDSLVTRYIADSVNSYDGNCGIGLGSEISQSGAVVYPTPIDKYVKETCKIYCYGRYNDDSYIIHPSREYALRCLEGICRRAEELGIRIHTRKTKVHNLATDDFEYLKKRIHITETGKILFRITRKNIQREEERIQSQAEEYRVGRIPLHTVLQSYQCWRSYAQKCQCYGAVGNMDRYFTGAFGEAIQTETGGGGVRYGRPKRIPKENEYEQASGY